jgi:hypothetical protein
VGLDAPRPFSFAPAWAAIHGLTASHYMNAKTARDMVGCHAEGLAGGSPT